jgi:hypothetical protein
MRDPSSLKVIPKLQIDTTCIDKRKQKTSNKNKKNKEKKSKKKFKKKREKKKKPYKISPNKLMFKSSYQRRGV